MKLPKEAIKDHDLQLIESFIVTNNVKNKINKYKCKECGAIIVSGEPYINNWATYGISGMTRKMTCAEIIVMDIIK